MMAVNTSNKDFSVEYTSVSGILYVTIDRKMLFTQKFDEHVKLHIVFNEEIVRRQIAFDGDGFERKADEGVEIQDIKLEQEPLLAVADNSEEVELSGDNNPLSAFAVDPDMGSDTDEMPEAQEDQNDDDDDYKPGRRKRTMKISKTLVSKKKKITPKAKGSAESAKSTSTKRVSKESRPMKTGKLPARERKERKSVANSRLKNKRMNVKKTKMIKSVDQEQDIYCQYCCKQFKTEREFRSHNRIERKEHHCVKCNRVLFSKAHLLLHMDDHEKKEASEETVEESESGDTRKARLKPRKCPICGMVRSTFDSLKIHVKIHTGENEYKCCICGQLNRSCGGLVEHMRKHVNDSFGQVTCKVCNIIFASRDELAAHRSTHPFPCGLCGKEFPNRSTLNGHCNSFHKHDGLKCHLCDKIFSSKEALDAHVEYHNYQKKTQCPTCGGFYVRLKRHIEQKHPPEDTLYVCDKCPKQFKSRMCFKKHMVVHSDKKPYECQECSKCFARSAGLMAHMRLHNQERPYVCDICGKACKIMGNLRHHMRTHQKSGVNFGGSTTIHPDLKQHPPWLSNLPHNQSLKPTDESSIRNPAVSDNDPSAGPPGNQ